MTKTELKIYNFIKEAYEGGTLTPIETSDVQKHFLWSYTHTYLTLKSMLNKGFLVKEKRFYKIV